MARPTAKAPRRSPSSGRDDRAHACLVWAFSMHRRSTGQNPCRWEPAPTRGRATRPDWLTPIAVFSASSRTSNPGAPPPASPPTCSRTSAIQPSGSCARCQRCDLVVIGRQTHFRFETQDQPDTTLAGILRGSPRPIVIVPRQLLEGQGIVVAYGGGREAARTLQTFQLLGLAGGEEIDVVSVHRDPAEAEAIVRLAGDFLSAHGTPHRLHAVASDVAPAEIVLDEVRRRRPRLLVMGAHGYHGLRDLFATSVTRAVLGACPVPVFVGA